MLKPTEAAVMKMTRAVLLRQYRLDLNIKSVKLAEQLPFHNSKLSQLENGYYDIKEEDLKAILEHYEITVDEFNKRAQLVFDEIQHQVISLRCRSSWITLQKCTSWVFEKRLKAGMSIYS